jgi:hypothetical protein
MDAILKPAIASANPVETRLAQTIHGEYQDTACCAGDVKPDCNFNVHLNFLPDLSGKREYPLHGSPSFSENGNPPAPLTKGDDP